MPLVSVAPEKKFWGWNSPADDSRKRMKVMELREALLAEYDTDAYMTMYSAGGQTHIHRVNLCGYEIYPHPLQVTVFCADYDNPAKPSGDSGKRGHEPWPEGEEKSRVSALVDAWRKAELLQGAIFHSTLKGIHIIQPLLVPIPIKKALPYFRWWLFKIREAGVEYDKAIEQEVGRLWRLPKVRREHNGALIDYRPSVMLLDDAKPLALPELSQEELAVFGGARESSKGVRVVRAKLAEVQLPDAGEPWRYRAKMIARAAEKELENWHRMFMFLAGALLDKGAPPSRLAAICEAISVETGADDRRQDRLQSAKSTLERVRRGDSVGGYTGLLREWRGVALALDESLCIRTAEDYEHWLTGAAKPGLLAGHEIGQRVLESLRQEGDGVSAYALRAGSGKSASAMDETAERARGVVRSASGRAPLGSKTAISVDKHELAKQYQQDLKARGIEAKRLFSPLTVLRDDGSPECIHHEIAELLVPGGISMQWELCQGRNTDRCERYETCRARLGFDGPEDALVTIGTHARIEVLAEEAGSTGTLYSDEPPSVFERITVTREELKSATLSLRNFSTRFECAMRPALQALMAWLHCETPSAPRDPAQVLREYASEVDQDDLRYAIAQTGVQTGDPVELAQAAIAPEEARGRHQLPLSALGRHVAMAGIEHAGRIGQAARTLGAVHRALTSELPGAGIWQEERDGKNTIVLYLPREGYIRALQRQGRTVILDADAKSSLPLLARFLGYDPPLRIFEVADGADIERTWRMVAGANRSGWFEGAALRCNSSLVGAVQDALHWAACLGLDKSLGIITMLPIELALRLSLNPHDRDARKDWERLSAPADGLERFQAEFGPALRARTGPILWGHYGAIKGLNHMAGLDLLVTIGDPWPNVMCTAHEASFAELDQTARARGEEQCANELAQAQGRLRTVHRERPGWALHVGAVRPAGQLWLSGVQVVAPGGRPSKTRTLTPEQVKAAVERLGGVDAAAWIAKCSARTLYRSMTGERALDGSSLDRLAPFSRRLVA